ncbi:MAG: cation-transporting P-type ATPase, partial [Thermoleophilia bacterium]
MEPSQATEAPHSLSSEDILTLLGSSLAKGLSRGEAAGKLARFGPNQLPSPPRISRLKLLLDQFRSVLIIVLLAA